MTKRITVTLLIFCLIVCLTFGYSIKSYADPVSSLVIGGATLAIMNSLGLSSIAHNYSAYQLENWITSEYEGYSVSNPFSGEIRSIAGKLVVTSTAYNYIISFIDYLKGLYPTDAPLVAEKTGDGDLKGYFGYSASIVTSDNRGAVRLYLPTGGYSDSTFTPVNAILHGLAYSCNYMPENNNMLQRWVLNYETEKTHDIGHVAKSVTIVLSDKSYFYPDLPFYSKPSDISDSYEWEGAMDGWTENTSLDQMIESIYDDTSGNTVDVSGEIVQVQPEPTPVPTYPPAPDVLSGINTIIEQINDTGVDIGGMKEGIEDLNDLLGEQTGVLEGINDVIGTQTGVLEGINDLIGEQGDVLEGINDAIGTQTEVLEGIDDAIGTQTGVISGAIEQAVSDVETAIGEQTAALDETLSSTAEGVETIAEALEDESINWQKFNLRGLFPFCIPFDIYNMLEALDASPAAPHVQLPFVIESIGFNYTIDLDFSVFDQVAAVMRQMELIVYGIALAWATSKVIKW